MEQHIRQLVNLAKVIHSVFPRFYLAGGTNLMLKCQHIQSIDLYFFSEKIFSFHYAIKKIQTQFNVQKLARKEDNLDFWMSGIKISLVYFPFKNIERTIIYQGIPFASDLDIFLNKIYVAGRRIDDKDIFDIAFLYNKYQEKWDFQFIKNGFENKFPLQSFENYLGAVFSLEDYPSLDETTKNIIYTMQKNYLKL